MASPRLTRLQNDYEKLRSKFDGHPFIHIEPLGTTPPERYRVTYRVPSLRLDPNGRTIESNVTVVEFQLPATYPKDKPRAVAMEEVFHPNFGDYVCIADFWSPAQTLADIILDVGQMLQWQKYNILSPLNAVAANWATKNLHQLPVGQIQLDVFSATPVLNINPIEG